MLNRHPVLENQNSTEKNKKTSSGSPPINPSPPTSTNALTHVPHDISPTYPHLLLSHPDTDPGHRTTHRCSPTTYAPLLLIDYDVTLIGFERLAGRATAPYLASYKYNILDSGR
jgi:hypothetical protein